MRPDTLQEDVIGQANPAWQRLFATATVLVALAGLARLYWTTPQAFQGNGAWFVTAVLGALLASYWFVLSASTRIDGEGIRQTGLPERHVRWEEISAAQLGGFSFARRLRVRTVGGRRLTFAGATPALHAAFEKIAAAYPPGRRSTA